MQEYIATFFTHYDAILFQRCLRERGISGQLAPVPRKLSSSCGTCARFSADPLPQDLPFADCEQLVRLTDDAFLPIVDNR